MRIVDEPNKDIAVFMFHLQGIRLVLGTQYK